MQQLVRVETKDQEFPGGTIAGGWRWSLTQGSTSFPDQVTEGPEATFDVEGGTYTVSVVRVDSEGNPLGPVASNSFTGSGGKVTIQVADKITVVDPNAPVDIVIPPAGEPAVFQVAP